MSSEAAAGGSTTIIESVEFRATAPATRLPGLDNAQRKLEALSAAIKQVQSQMAGIGTNSMFKLSAQQYAQFGYDKNGKSSLGIGAVARRAGFGPEAVKDIRQSANRMVSEVHRAIGLVEREIERSPAMGKKALAARQQQIQQLKNILPFTGTKGNPASSFASAGAAGMFFGGGLAAKFKATLAGGPKLPKGFSFDKLTRALFDRGYAGEALANQNQYKDALRGLFHGTMHDNGPAPMTDARVAKAVNEALKQDAKGRGKKADAAAAADAVSSGGSGSGGGKKGKGKGKGGGGGGGGGGEDGDEEERVLVPQGGPQVEKRVEKTPGGKDRTTTTTRQGPFKTESALEVEGKILKLVSRDQSEKQQAATFRDNLATLQREFQRDLPNAGTPKTSGPNARPATGLGGFDRLRRGYADAAIKMFSQVPGATSTHGALLEGFLQGTLPAAEQTEMARVGEQRKKLLKQRYAAEQKDDKLKRANIQAELDSLEAHRKALGKFNQSGQRAAKDIAREQKKTGAFDQKNAQASAFRTATTQGAMDLEADLVKRGAKVHKLNTDQLTGRHMGASYTIEENGRLNKYRVDYNKAGDATARMTSSLKPVNKNHDRLDQAIEGLTLRNQAANLVKVTAWSAAVMVLYKAAELAGYSMRRMEQTGLEMAHLDVVFRGVGGTVQELTTDMMKLASTEGRATSEAMESAQSWARLGGDRKTINEEVRVSAEAANIANMHMAETSKQLQSLMHIYHLEAADLDGTLGSLVATSLRYNVTLEEMFTGLDRSAAAARVAGISLAELQGMLAVVTGTTGATGSTTGNALKYVFQEMNKGDVQQTLRDRYKVETLDDQLNQKPVGQTLGDLSGIWGTLGKREQQALGGTLGGRFNAARVPVVIEQYPEILKQAIDSQLGLNAAQTANAKILDTVKANMAGLRAEYDRLIMSGNVLAKVNMGAALGRGLMQEGANLFSGPSPSDAEQKAKREDMLKRMTANPLWSQAAGIGRTLTRNVMPWMRNLGMTGPGMVDYFNLMHEDRPAAEDGVGLSGRLMGLRKKERASALQAQSMGIAATMLGNNTMTTGNANIFADTMRGMGGSGSADATDFLNARKANNTPAALLVVNRVKDQAFANKKAALEARADLLATNRASIEKANAANDAAITDKQEHHQNADAELKQKADLSAQLEKNKSDVDDLSDAYEGLQGEIGSVQVTQQKYLDLLKTQEGLMAGIEQRFTMVEGHTASQKLAQETGALTAQLAEAKRAIEAYDATHDKTLEGDATRAQLVERSKTIQASLASAQGRTGQAAGLTSYQHGVEGSENTARAVNYGYNETEKLLRVRKELLADAARTEAQLGTAVEGTAEYEELTGRYVKDNALAYERTLDLARRRADVEAEIHQLAIDQNREFSRSFFGAGAADMLRKLAAFKLALGGGVTQGQLYSMGPAMRQDVGSLTGMNPDMARLLRERRTLMGNGFASGGYTGDGPADEVAGVVHRGEFVIPREGLSGESNNLDDYAVRKTGERNRKPHGDNLQTWRNYYEDQFEKDNAARTKAADELPGNERATENIPGYVSPRQRDLKRTSAVAKAATLPAGAAALYGAARLAMRGGGGSPASAATALRGGVAMDQHVQEYEGMLKRLDPAYAAMRRMGLNNRLRSLWPSAQGPVPSSELGRLDPVHGALRWAMGLGNSVAKRKPVSAAVQAARARYQQMMSAMNNEWTANPFHNSTATTAENFNTMFGQKHSSVFGGPAGIHAPRGIPLDDIDALHAPQAGGLQMAPPSQTYGDEIRELLAQTHGQGGNWPAPSLGATARNAATRGLNAAGRGWTAARGFLSNPKSWVNMGKGLGMAGIGAGVTGGLNWAGGKMGIHGSDTYGGAAYGLFTDAVGGAVAGSRGGPLGAGIGAVGAMALGSGMRVIGGVRDLNRATFGGIQTHRQVDAAQQAMLQRQRARAEAPGPAPEHRVSPIQHPGDAASERRSAAAMAAADAASRRWHSFNAPRPKPIMGSNGLPAPINPATGLPWSSGTDHSIEGRPHPAHAAARAAAAAPNNSAVMPVVRPAAGGGSAPAANGGDDTAIKNATAALDLLATTAGKLNTAFAALATRADALFKGGGNGLQFQPTGQMGGSYPGKTH